MEQASRVAHLMIKAPAFVCTLAGPEHIFDFANDQYRKLAGHRELVGNPVRAVFPEVASQGFFELLDRVYRTGEPFVGQEIRISLHRGDGQSEIRHLNFVYEAIRDESGAISGIFVHGVDVSDFVEARNRLQQSEERLAQQNRELADLAAGLERQQRLFDTALSSIVDFAYVFDLNGRFLYVNKALLTLWGLSLTEAVGRNFHDLPYSAELATRLQTQIRQVIEMKCRVTDETSYTSPSGVEGYYEYIFVPVFAADGSVEAVAGSTREISERKRTERALAQARDDAQRLSRVKDEFLATLSHELRTPLQAILGWTQLLERYPEHNTRDGIAAISRNARIQAQLIDDLLDLQRIETGKMRLDIKPHDLNEAVLRAVESVAPAAQAKQLRIETVCAASPATVLADPNRLQQVIWNLLVNAVKFTDAGGHVRVETRTNADALDVVVADSGIGMAPAFLRRAFDRFDQEDASTKAVMPGLGIGLALVKQIVQLHGGSVQAESPGKGQGATFTVRLPKHSG